MDEATEQRWRQSQPPFDGLTLYTGRLPTSTLVTVARTLVDLLQRLTPCRELRTFEDWHEHDGYNKDGVDAGWNELSAAVQSEQAFRASSPGDDLVRRAWLAGDASFYLRWFWYPGEQAPLSGTSDDPVEGGDVDMTARPAIVREAQQVLAASSVETTFIPAAEFFAGR